MDLVAVEFAAHPADVVARQLHVRGQGGQLVLERVEGGHVLLERVGDRRRVLLDRLGGQGALLAEGVEVGGDLGDALLHRLLVAALRTDRRRLGQVLGLAPVVFVSGNVEDGIGKNVSALVVGTNRQGVEMNPTPLVEGRYFTPAEENQNVCILCDRPRHDLFGNGPALGHTVRIKYKDWKVVGVLNKPKQDDSLIGHMLGLGNLVYLPAAAAKREFPTAQINRIVLKTDFKHPAHDLVAGLKQTMLASHAKMEDFGVMTQEKGLALVVKLVSMAQSLLVLIAAISLVVAGVGIMNIMLVTVTERTREIGIRKTVGARNVDILQQFLIEAVILAVLGGTVGLGLSAILCFLISRFSALTPVLGPGAISLALIVCVCVGLVFGVAPALRASKLNPIDALRHE